MSLRHQLLTILSDGRFHSGQALGAALGISRAAIWKHIHACEAIGVKIYPVRGKGYRLAEPIELLQAKRVRGFMSAHASRCVTDVEVHLALDSTNDYLQAKEIPPTGRMAACLTETQTAGRGRRGRAWFSPFGAGLYLSMNWNFPNGASELGGASLVAGLAVLRAFKQLGIDGAGLKWPNDILWNGAKLAGVLLDVAGEASGPCKVVVGVGINVRLDPEAMRSVEQPWVDMHTLTKGKPPTRNQLAGVLLEQLVDVLALYQSHGMEAFLEEWQEADLVSGRQVQLVLPNDVITGTADGIDLSGALVMNINGTQRHYTSGEVSVRTIT